MNSNLKEKISQLPMSPGVYIYKDISGKVIYVGKAKQLKNRVGSYFQSGILPGTKTYALVSRINDIDTVNVETELEAVVLEAELIKKYRPKYNIIQKDDRSYIYIVIRGKEFPNVFTARKTDVLPKDKVYGPYPDGRAAREIVRRLRTIFPYKDCSDTKYSRFEKLGRPCLYGHLGLCPSPCVSHSEKDVSLYKINIQNIKKVLSGKSNKIVTDLESKMRTSSRTQDYESAIYYRDILNKYKYISNSIRSPEQYIENPYLIEDIANEALKEIEEKIPLLKVLPKRIECYDISNISGKQAVGSMVVATDGRVDKREYRRFRIKMGDEPNDFGMLTEVLTRRLKRSGDLSDNIDKWPWPDMLLIDGGKGQVDAVMKVVSALGLSIPVVGVAKQFETLVYKTEGRFTEMRLEKDNKGLSLLLRLRDEAHRFAQSYHHLLRKKSIRA